MKDPIVKSATANQKEEMHIINQPGKRFEKLIVVNEKDSAKIKQKKLDLERGMERDKRHSQSR
jgi:hypothetical protein